MSYFYTQPVLKKENHIGYVSTSVTRTEETMDSEHMLLVNACNEVIFFGRGGGHFGKRIAIYGMKITIFQNKM